MRTKLRIPVRYVRPICIVAVILGIIFTVTGNIIAGLCMLLGSFTLERGAYKCTSCGGRLTVRIPIMGDSYCPHCNTKL